MPHVALAGLALFASLTANQVDLAPILGRGAAAPVESAAVVITGKVLQNTHGDALVGGSIVHLDRMLVAPARSSEVVLEVVFVWVGPDADGQDWTELGAGDAVRVRGSLGLSLTGAPLIAGTSVERR